MAESETPTEPDPRAQARAARAERYFERDLAGQRVWYSARATRLKARAQALGVTVVGAGAATTFCQVFGQVPWVPVVTALLGALVAVAEGWRQIARYDEAWAAYRVASERMKREKRLYVNGAGDYRRPASEDEAFLCFVEAVEAIVAEEQRIYWRDRGDAHDTAGQVHWRAGRGQRGAAVTRRLLYRFSSYGPTRMQGYRPFSLSRLLRTTAVRGCAGPSAFS